MLPLKTLKLVDLHLNHSKKESKINPQKYTYTVEILEQIKKMILIECGKNR